MQKILTKNPKEKNLIDNFLKNLSRLILLINKKLFLKIGNLIDNIAVVNALKITK